LEREETALRQLSGPNDVFRTGIGHFYGLPETRDYMRARFAAAQALLEIDTKRSVETALEHLSDMMRLCRSDNLGVRDIVPHLLLRLDREQECYDFLKSWATADKTGIVTTPYRDIRNGDPFEPIDAFSSGQTSLDHLVALTLMKLRLYLDLGAYPSMSFDYFSRLRSASPGEFDRPVGRLVRERMKTMKTKAAEKTRRTLKTQYHALCQRVYDANPYFWEALVDGETPTPPPYYSPGSKEEADLVLHQCRRAWDESEDAIMMVSADTAALVQVYQGPATRAGGNNTLSESPKHTTLQPWETSRGTGRVFPLRFTATSPPLELFEPTAGTGSIGVRLVHRSEKTRVLVFVDGACVNNGQPEPRAGWAVVLGVPRNDGDTDGRSIVSGRLEDQGPFGESFKATSNRAELRAVIAALRACDWRADGYTNLVIATDASYVVDGATQHAKRWVRNGWKIHTGDAVKNQDLWELLLGEAERWDDKGLRVEMWKTPRELNHAADKAAKHAASSGAAVARFRDIAVGSDQCTTTGSTTSPRILALCLECEDLFDDIYRDLVSSITSKTKMDRARTSDAALTLLSQEPRPSVILVTDGAITRERKVWERVIDLMREGATVILAGCFSTMVNEGDFSRLFARVGLPWKRGSYHRTVVSLHRDVVGGDLARRLPASYSQKALFAQNVEQSAAWYSEGKWSPEAAVVFARVGQGRLGYIGDVNGEKSSNQVVLAMCGLL
jgi:ribonuclease HI